MKKIQIICILTGLVMTAASCKKYLDVPPKGKVILTNVSDYDLFLNSQTLTASGARELNLLSDESDAPAMPQVPDRPEDLVYLWTSQYTNDTKIDPLFWGRHYANIYRFNAVLTGIELAGNGTVESKKRIRSEALLGRAFEYLYLVNLYAKPYNAATAATDLATPFVTSTDLSAQTPPRSTVADIYNRIITDINEALPGLPANNAGSRFRGSVAAGYSVLARTYLYMGRYSDAAKYAALALGDKPVPLIDYNTLASGKVIPGMAQRAVEIYARYSTNASYTEIPTLDFLKKFDTSDLRLRFFYTKLEDFSFKKRGISLFDPNAAVVQSYGTSVEEMKLIIAEAAARSGDIPKALEQLDDIRRCRIRKDKWAALTAGNKEEALQLVIRERGFELAFRGFRWIDMRRLNAEGKMPTVYRYGADNAIRATLAPKSPRYTLQIPLSVLSFNPEMPMNEE
ncbi:RagB/SusD family nutrient uptake outer membrane protein [Chitinophaga sp. Mgbs1]|uniref:RagB/SusD family nutrient uptake outer membrane protein n=1 Tax=Chitinophaga solisilvae TaxID=1233460 RepID=A0A433WBS7_9BACT|nr:RagB/SusD family nutrient uptake outer membrane protein [Chitinophaga solisilvae]